MRFDVKLAPLRTEHEGVIVENKSVIADYFRIEQGALIFRNRAQPRHYGDSNSFPEPVHIFAAGVWAEVEVAQ